MEGGFDCKFFPDVVLVSEDKPGRPDKAQKLVVLDEV